VATLELRLRVTSPELLSLPWSAPLSDWDPTTVALRDVPVGPSRHLVRFVEADRHLWALKALPRRVAQQEYDVLRHMEQDGLSAVRPAGVVLQPSDDDAILVTHYLESSWQYRRLLMRVPASMSVHRGRLFDAMAVLLVELHRNGIYWGDCSLANTLFMRDGQAITAWMVDAETAELHERLSDGQRRMDLEVMVENVAGGLLDVAARRDEPPEAVPSILDEARSVAERYELLWGLLHDEPIIGIEDHYEIESRLRRLNESGFAVDEVRFESTGEEADRVRMHVTVAGRRFHAEQLARLCGLHVGEGQARILLNDLRSFHTRMQQESRTEISEEVAARHWMLEAYEPGSDRAHAALGRRGDTIQAYCDLLEVRWLLSEEAGYDVGDAPALAALAERRTPDEAAANLSFVEMATEELPRITPEEPR
jgi:hypothetical protein